jgi:hypothetical protein
MTKKEVEKENEASITTELEKYKTQGCNLLMPSTHIAGLSEWHHPIIEEVLLSADPNNGDVYAHDDAEVYVDKDKKVLNLNKKFRPTKQALMKLSVCAGVIWSPTGSHRVDNGADRNYIAYKAIGGIKKADGRPVFFSAEYDIDFTVLEAELRDSYQRKADAKDKQGNYYKKTEKERTEYVEYCVNRDMLQKRKFKLRLCEAGAMNRVLRMLLGLKQAYTTAELSKPFVMARIVFRPDFSDAAVRKQFIDASIKAMTGIYGPQALDQEIRETKPEDIIDLPPNGSEEDNDHLPLETDPKAPGQSDLIDFENADVHGQCAALTNTANQKGYDLGEYQKRAGAANLAAFSKEKRVDLFKHLLAMPDKGAKPSEAAKLNEDVPY